MNVGLEFFKIVPPDVVFNVIVRVTLISGAAVDVLVCSCSHLETKELFTFSTIQTSAKSERWMEWNVYEGGEGCQISLKYTVLKYFHVNVYLCRGNNLEIRVIEIWNWVD